jgi:DNA-nicking Smr family endonuclease
VVLRARAAVLRRPAARRPTEPARAAQPPEKSRARRIDEDEQKVFLDALQKLHLDKTFVDDIPDEETTLRPLPVNRMRQIRRGAIRLDYELDLHGLTRDEALEALAAFVGGAYNRGQQAVLVITGKGNNSPGEPVLQGAVAAWLRGGGQRMVAEFAVAPTQLGGAGAFVVFLRDKTAGR